MRRAIAFDVADGAALERFEVLVALDHLVAAVPAVVGAHEVREDVREPAVVERVLRRARGRRESRLRMLVGEVHQDRDRLEEHEVAVDHGRYRPGRVDEQVLLLRHVLADRDDAVLDADQAQGHGRHVGDGLRLPVELDHVRLAFEVGAQLLQISCPGAWPRRRHGRHAEDDGADDGERRVRGARGRSTSSRVMPPSGINAKFGIVAHALPAQPGVEALGVAAGRGVEHEQRPAAVDRDLPRPRASAPRRGRGGARGGARASWRDRRGGAGSRAGRGSAARCRRCRSSSSATSSARSPRRRRRRRRARTPAPRRASAAA